MYESRRWSHPLQIFASASDPPAGCGACGSPVFPHRQGPSLSAAPLPSLPTCPPFSIQSVLKPTLPLHSSRQALPLGSSRGALRAHSLPGTPLLVSVCPPHTHTPCTPHRSCLSVQAPPTIPSERRPYDRASQPPSTALDLRPSTCIFKLLALPLVNGQRVGGVAPRAAIWAGWVWVQAPAGAPARPFWPLPSCRSRWICSANTHSAVLLPGLSRPEPWWPGAMLLSTHLPWHALLK